MGRAVYYVICSVLTIGVLYGFRIALTSMNDDMLTGFIIGMVGTLSALVLCEKLAPGCLSGRISGSRLPAVAPE